MWWGLGSKAIPNIFTKQMRPVVTMPSEKGNQKSHVGHFPWASKCIRRHLRRCWIFLWSNAALTCCINDAGLSTSSEQTTQSPGNIRKAVLVSTEFLITPILGSAILAHLSPYFCVLSGSPWKPTGRISFIPGLKASLTWVKRASRKVWKAPSNQPRLMSHAYFESQFY